MKDLQMLDNLIKKIVRFLDRRRIEWLRADSPGIDKSVVLHSADISMMYPERIAIGANTSINGKTVLNARGGITIGEHCTLSEGVMLQSAGLNIEYPYSVRRQRQKEITGDDHVVGEIVIEDGVWLCSSVIVCANVTVGRGSVVASGAVVVTDIPSFELWGGVPAKKINSLDE